MRPGQLLGVIFAGLAISAIALAGAALWAFASYQDVSEPRTLILLGCAGLLLFIVLLILSWAALQLRIARPIEALAREVETLIHARKVRPITLPDGHMTGGLADALQDLIVKFIAAREETGKAVVEATQRSEIYQRRLETILLDLSEGVIVCNLDNRILLYNEAAAQILARPERLGLGRRLFGLFERGPILAVLDDLTDKQLGDTKRKLRARRKITCTRLDSAPEIEAHIALICSDEVETEGYVLTFTGETETSEDTQALPPRPEFYDFDLFRRTPEREVLEIPLRELRCAVFDTETTGLEPSKGDEIISIGAVRTVNGRIVRGETFEQLINPGKTIPRASIKFHGIKDADVKDKPAIKEVLPRFSAFAGRGVMVAHNAAFDMKFLVLKEKQSGVAFRNPVLDILLLSVFLHDHMSDHSLNATAQRLGIDISGRHTALGDAMTTAEIFLAMLGPLHQRGVVTLGDALDVSAKMTKIRKQQAKF